MYNNKNLQTGATYFLFICFLFIVQTHLNAQLESSKWIFGRGAGIDFKNGVAQSFTGSKINTIEGCSTLSDGNGNLLFYTDGISVWNKNNELMPNGKDLNGNISSTQSTIIVPLPESNTFFYIFTVDSEAGKSGLSYSIVDLSKENGLGDITLKNKLINIHFTEKLAAIKQPDSNNMWIIAHEYESNAFIAYLLTKNGLAPNPVVSAVGMKHEKSVFNAIGYMKISPDKTKLAVAINGNRLVQLFNFDAKNGTITNPLTLTFNSQSSPYGLEFSPNSSLLYISVVSSGSVYQANITAGNEQAIQNSLQLVGRSKNKKSLGALQSGTDGRIYVAEYESKFLSVIDHPNTIGTDCSYRSEAIPLNGKTCMLGLPTFVQDFVKTNNSNHAIQTAGKVNAGTNNKYETNNKYILSNVYFDFNKAALTNTYISELQQLADYLSENKKINIEIIGHTDSIGNTEYNKKLSAARAKEIEIYLTKKGIETSRVTFSGKGSSEPLAPNKDEAGRIKNRRVEFILKNSSQYSEQKLPIKTNKQLTKTR